MRRTAQIQYLNLSDNQISAIKKINANFLSVSRLMYGSQGQRGPTGPTGPVGYEGERGPTGNSGTRGTRWFVSGISPQGGPGDSLIYGDYWVDSSQDSNEIKIFSPSGWVNSGYRISTNSVFKNIEDVVGFSGLTGGVRSTVVASNPEISTFNFSDTFLLQSNANPAHSLFGVSIDPQKSGAYNILEFSRGDLNSGAISSYINNPVLRFRDASSSNSNLDLVLSSSDIFIKSHAPASSSIGHDILLKTSGPLSIYGDTSFSLGSRGDSASSGFSLNSTGQASITSGGQFIPNFKNILQDPLVTEGTGRMRINSRISSTISTNSLPTVKFENTTQVYDSGGSFPVYFSNFQSILSPDSGLTISQLLDGGNHIKISTNTSGSNPVEMFSISASGRVYSKKRSRRITSILRPTNNIDTSSSIAWYLMGTKDVTFTYTSDPEPKTLAFKADTNEVYIDPSLVDSSNEIGVGLWFCYSDTGTNGYGSPEMVGGSFSRMFGPQGETFRMKIRSVSPTRKIKHIGITKTSPFVGPVSAPSSLVGSYPQTSSATRYASLLTPASEVELLFKREGSTPTGGFSPSSVSDFPWGQGGDKVYWFACGQCGVFTSRGVLFDPAYQAVLDYADSQGYVLPSTTQQILQNQLVIDLIATGDWGEMDSFAVFATDGDSDFALIDWIRLETMSQSTGPLTFIENQGFATQGTGFIASGMTIGEGGHYKLGDASVGAWVYELPSTGGNWGICGSSTSSECRFYPYRFNQLAAINGISFTGASGLSQSTGIMSLEENGTSATSRNNGAVVSTAAGTSTSVGTGPYTILKSSSGIWEAGKPLSMAFKGSASVASSIVTPFANYMADI